MSAHLTDHPEDFVRAMEAMGCCARVEPLSPRLVGHYPVMTFGLPGHQPLPHAFCYLLRDEWAGLPPGTYVRCGQSVWMVPGTQAE